MNELKFRNPDIFQVLPFREWIRHNLPNGQNGVVVEDLDLLMRVYGKNFQCDDDGKFMEIDLKFWPAWIGYAQAKTFGMKHRLLREADPFAQKYIGFFVIQYSDDNWDSSKFWVNKTELQSKQELLDFLLFKKSIKSLFD